MILNDNKKVWAPDGRDGFRLGKVVDIGSETITVQLEDGKTVSPLYKRVFAAEDDNSKDYDDNCALMYLNEATLLNNVKIRYKCDKIYTYVANILIAVNPYHTLASLYSPQAIQSYKGKSIGVLPPHVFAIADKAYRDMKVNKKSQSIIVSGESGAGKTESTKYILRYLTDCYGQGGVGNIEKRIVEANPLLEAFGNAKTLRNLNSSRFGKYVEIHFDEKTQLVGAFVSHYLLEKSRIVRQSPGERNYHVFYRICAGAPADMKSALRLSDAKSFQYLNKGSLKEPSIDDVKDFQLVDNAMNSVGIPLNHKANIYRLVAAVLHLGNITFQESTKDKKGGSELTSAGEGYASIVAKLLGLHGSELALALTTRVMMTTKGGGMGTLYKIPLKPEQAASGRDALAKAIYSRLFDHIVSCVNQCFPFKASANYIGVLDIAGFEFFEVNSFEQLCINYCNEKLQQFFNERILKDEQALYIKEGLGVKTVAYTDNQDCIDLFEQKGIGLFDVLDEEMKFPAPSDVHFTTEIHAKNSKHFRLAVPRKSPLSIHRAVKDDQGFLIRHFAGAVCYQAVGFLDKNNDALHDSLEQLIQESSDPFLKSLFPQPSSGKPVNTKSKKLAFESVGKKFRSQLKMLMDKLTGTGSSFIRCIKPNDQMRSKDFEGGQILSQLQCAGMVSVLELMQEGFPSRTAFLDLHTKYKSFLPPKLSKLDPRTFCNALFRAVGMDEDDFKFGMTKVFFRPGKFAEFDQIMRSDPQALNALVSKVLKWIVRNRWKRAIWCAVSVQKLANKIKFRRDMLIRIQKTAKMFIAIQKHKPRYKALIKMRTLEVQLGQLMSLVSSLKKDKDKFSKDVQALKTNVENSIRQIKSTIMNQRALDERYDELVKQINNQLNILRSQKAVQEEQERLRKIQEQMELEKKKQEQEEQRRHEEERKRRERIAYEARMKAEAEQAEKKRKMDEERMNASLAKLKIEDEAKEQQRSQQEEQEQRDYELALRLAADPSTMVSDEKVRLKRNIDNGNGKFAYLKKWTFPELRDTINTSCDLDLLEACRIEFHRRMKVYHAWRKRNNDKSKNAPTTQRAPVDIIRQSHVTSEQSNNSKPSKDQRCFRVPFAKPSDQYRDPENTKSGWWYAHFDGEYAARQLEIHPTGTLLLVSGVDDMDMLEMSLTETRLVYRPGAEITLDEFDTVWKSYGGKCDKVYRAKPKK